MGDTPTKQTKVHRNPAWSRDELILALDLYLHHPKAIPPPTHQDVLELSEFLERVGRLMGLPMSRNFRSPDSVVMKLGNFSRFDPYRLDGGLQGLSNGSREDERVWDDFSRDHNRLTAVAATIRAAVEARDVNSIPHLDDDDYDPQEAAEGKILTRMHRLRERRRKLVNDKKKEAMRKHGRLTCEVCGFNFADRYGSTATDVIDVHHTRPVHMLKAGEKTNIKDLALLCSNCHRMVHSSKNWLSLDQVRALLAAAAR